MTNWISRYAVELSHRRASGFFLRRSVDAIRSTNQIGYPESPIPLN